MSTAYRPLASGTPCRRLPVSALPASLVAQAFPESVKDLLFYLILKDPRCGYSALAFLRSELDAGRSGAAHLLRAARLLSPLHERLVARYEALMPVAAPPPRAQPWERHPAPPPELGVHDRPVRTPRALNPMGEGQALGTPRVQRASGAPRAAVGRAPSSASVRLVLSHAAVIQASVRRA